MASSKNEGSSSRKGVFFLSDQQLSERLQFAQEIGFGNWGSVWLCFPKVPDTVFRPDSVGRYPNKVAVKLVHRNKTPTNAARMRSLWNEMKVITSLNDDRHPSIISFHSFILTSSYALIAMEYLPHLIPVEVAEPKARLWFRSLVSAVNFLHEHGVVHNDIKPANILLTKQRIPVLVDFGFAENYDLKSSKAFLSSVSYGTPEYLAPERARGNLHDTRKSDIWSLGITFFEILVGRTPFEYTEGEQFVTKDDLEEYWGRTIKGKWVGEWNMSKACEKMLKKMIAPNADIRYNALRTMDDHYWNENIEFHDDDPQPRISRPEKIVVVDANSRIRSKQRVAKDMGSPMFDENSPKRRNRNDFTLAPSPKKKLNKSHRPEKENIEVQNRPRRMNVVPSLPSLNLLSPTPKLSALKDAQKRPKPIRANETKGRTKVDRVLVDVTGLSQNVDGGKSTAVSRKILSKVGRDRAEEFERLKQYEKERMLAEESNSSEEDARIFDSPSLPGAAPPPTAWRDQLNADPNAARSSSTLHPVDALNTPIESNGGHVYERHSLGDLSGQSNFLSLKGQGLKRLQESVKSSLDKPLRLCKSSTLQNLGSLSSLLSKPPGNESSRLSMNLTQCEPWEDESLIRAAKSSLPVVRHAIHNQQVGAESRADRMTIWIRNVEQIVKDTQENFASSNLHSLPPLPTRPVSRPVSQMSGVRPIRSPRRILPADQIFATNDASILSYGKSEYLTANYLTANDNTDSSLSPQKDRHPSLETAELNKPFLEDVSYERKSTSPLPVNENGHPARFPGPIASMANLQVLLDEEDTPSPSVPLSHLLDRSVFVATPVLSSSSLRNLSSIPTIPNESILIDDAQLTEHRRDTIMQEVVSSKAKASTPKSPIGSEQIEDAYDRFLMATSGVSRNGRGYQSTNFTASSNNFSANNHKRNLKFFHSTRRMPPAVSSEDVAGSTSFEFGQITANLGQSIPRRKDDNYNAVRTVTSALKAFVNGKPLSRRQSGML